MLSEYFDLYMQTSDSIYNFQGFNQPASIFMEPLTPQLLYVPENIYSNIYSMASAFIDTGMLEIKFQGRDRVQNFGQSIDSVYYQIASPSQINRFSSPSGLATVMIPPGALDYDRGVMLMEYDIEPVEERESYWQITNEVYVSPDMYQLNIPATIELSVDKTLVDGFDPWMVQIFKRINNEWLPMVTDYKDGIAMTQTYELGYFSVFVNLNATDQELNYIPYTYDLKYAYPNPFNPRTSIRFSVPIESEVNLSIYDLQGREIKELSSSLYQPGEYEVEWDASGQSSGVYLVKMTSLGYSHTMKVVLLK